MSKVTRFRIKTLHELTAAGWRRAGSADFGHISVEVFRHNDGSEVCLPDHRELGDFFSGRRRGDMVLTDRGGELPLSFVLEALV